MFNVEKRGESKMEATNDSDKVEVKEVFWGKVIDHRVYLFKGKTQVAFEDCSSYKVALEVADKWQKDNHTSSFEAFGPAKSAEKIRHETYVAKTKATEKAAKKEAKKVAKSKDQVAIEMAELQKQLDLLGE
jgi:hypothetical protein